MNGTHIKRLGVIVLVAGLLVAGLGSVGFESATVNRDDTSASIADNRGNASLAVELENESFSEPNGTSFHLLNVTNNLESDVEHLQVDFNEGYIEVESGERGSSDPLNETATSEVDVSCKNDTEGEKDVVVTVVGEARGTAVEVTRTVSINCEGGTSS